MIIIKKILEFLKKYRSWIIAGIFILIFISIAEDLLDDSLDIFDDDIYDTIKDFINPSLTNFFKVITEMSGTIFLLFASSISFFVFKNKKYGLFALINLANAVILNNILKIIFSRPRPLDLNLIEVGGYSFPSGHSMAAMAYYGFLIYLIWQTKWKKKTKWITSILLGTLILLIGISRIYLGVHYASDVIAGFCISLAYLIIFTSIISKHMIRKREK